MNEEEIQRLIAQIMREQGQQQPAQGGGLPPGAMQVAQQFMGGGGGAAAAAAPSGAAAAAPAGAAGGSGFGGAMAAAGPWAALAAGAVLNERQAKDKGRRASGGEYIGDLFTGSVAAQDTKDIGGKIGGPVGSVIAESGRFTEKMLKPWEWF